MSCRRHQQAIDRLFLHSRPLPAEGRLRTHLAGCEPCRNRYDLLAQLGRAQIASGSPLHADQLRAVGEGILDRVARRPAPSSHRAWFGVAIGSLATVALVILVWAPSSDEYQARGAGPSAGGAGLRAFCIAGSGADAAVVASAGPGETLRCRVGDAVQFAVSSPTPVEVAILGQGPDGTVLQYHSPQDAPSLGPSEGYVPLPRSNRLTEEHPRGVTRIVAAVAPPASGATAMANGRLEAQAPPENGQIEELRLEVAD